MLGTIAGNIHSVQLFGKITFTEKSTNNSQTAGWNDTFICKLDYNVSGREIKRNFGIVKK